MTLVYVLLVAHFIGDFLCQTDWMALNKSKRWDALAIHVGAYSLVLLFCLVALLRPCPLNDTTVITGTVGWLSVSPWQFATSLPVQFVALNAAAHFVQDAITSRINARLWQANERHWFFVSIGFDQLLHYVTLFVTANWWLR